LKSLAGRHIKESGVEQPWLVDEAAIGGPAGILRFSRGINMCLTIEAVFRYLSWYKQGQNRISGRGTVVYHSVKV
jgi:hypothetical protein